MNEQDGYYAIMDKSKKHIKIDAVSGIIYVFDNRNYAEAALAGLMDDGFSDIHDSSVLVDINKIPVDETLNDCY